MNDQQRAAMQMALEALEFAGGYSNGHGRSFRQSAASVEAITAMRQALEQAEQQEPVAYTNKEQLEYLKDPRYSNMPVAMWSKPFFESMNVELYAAPVDAKAIRAEVLEEAAKWFESSGANMMTKAECAAAIRGLK